MIERDLVNVCDLAITRPKRSGPAGDSLVANDFSVATDLCAIVEAEHAVIQDLDNRQQLVVASIWIDGVDANGDFLKVREGDLVQYTDWKGDLVKKQQVLRVSPGYCGTELDHVELSVGRSV